MNNKILLTLLLICSISIASAVSTTNNQITINQQIEESKSYSMQIVNDKDFEISNFTFSNLEDYGFNFPNITIEPNSNKTISFIVNSKKTANELVNSKVQFRYNTNISTQVTTYTMDITEDGFSKKYILLRSGDSIEWKNKDNIAHTIKFNDFTETVQPNQTVIHTFNNIGNFNYEDPTWSAWSGFNSEVQVITRSSTELIHNPDLDFEINFKLEISDRPTTLTANLDKTDFNVDSVGETEGLITIENTGNITATGVKITSNSSWILPQENNFNLEKDSTNYVQYKISPIIFSTEETNKTYPIEIYIEGLNSKKITKKINVFIPFNNDFDDKTSGTAITTNLLKAITMLNQLCDENPSACSGFSNSSSSYDGNYTFNASEVKIEELIKSISTISTEQENLRSKTGILADLVQGKLETQGIDVNETKNDVKELKKEISSNNTLLVIIIFGALIFALLNQVLKNHTTRKNQEIANDPFRTKSGVFD